MNVFTSSVIVVTVAVIVLVDASPAEYYATKYDHLAIEHILNNRRMVYHYANCLLNRGPCTPQGVEFRRILPEALETNCLRCTEKQKYVTYQTIKRLMKEYPKTWALLQAQWDPKDIYVKKFEESFRQTPSTAPPENEIIIEDRFGGNPDAITKPSTTKKTEVKKSKPMTSTVPVSSSTPSIIKDRFGGNPDTTTKPSTTKQTEAKKTEPRKSTVPVLSSTPTTIKTSRVPSINSIASASDNKPSRLPQNGGPQDIVTKVGMPYQEVDSASKTQVSSTIGVVSSSIPKITPYSTTSTVTSSPSTSTSQNSLSVNPLGVTFDIPQSSINHPQTQQLLRNNSSSSTNSNRVNSPASINQKIKSSNIQPDPISSLISSFLNANRPTTSRPKTSSTTTTPSENQNLQIKSQKISGHVRKAGSRKRTQLGINTTVQVSVRKPLIQVRLPGLTVNSQVEGFNPVGNFVRGLANAGDRLIETGTSIADSVLTSVRGIFNPRIRRNRALRRS